MWAWPPRRPPCRFRHARVAGRTVLYPAEESHLGASAHDGLFTEQGLDTVSTRNGSLRARHYLYSGDLNGEIWYDEDGRWVKLRFRAKDGSMIDYICRQCQAPTTITPR